MALRVKRRALSIRDKMKIIKYFDKKSENYKKTKIAEELDIPVSTLSTILKNRKDTEEKCKNLNSRVLKRKRNKVGKYIELENILLDWICSMNSQCLQINGPMIRKRALEIAGDLDIADFTGSSGWLDRFKKRHKITSRQTVDAETDGDDSSISSIDTFQEVLKDYQPCDIFNADEFGLFYKLRLNENLNLKDKKCENGALSSERLTILACVNSNGTEKLPLLVIGNEVISTNVPCQYEVEPRSWMTNDMFANWLKVLDDYFEIQGRLVVIIVDKSPVHSTNIVLNNINLFLVPPDSECEMAMTQGIIKTLKHNYRAKLIEICQEVKEISSPLSIPEALQYICDSWERIKPGIIQSCFQKSGFSDYYDVDDDDDDYKSEISMKYHDYLYIDYELATCGEKESDFNEIELKNTTEASEIFMKDEGKIIRDVKSNGAAATALTSIANLKTYLSSINSQHGLEKLAVIENIILESVDDTFS